MAYCPECSSEISEVEGFCPYCGISLHPVAVDEETESKNDEFIHEIINDSTENPVEKAELSSQSEISETNNVSMLETIVESSIDIISELLDETSENSPEDTAAIENPDNSENTLQDEENVIENNAEIQTISGEYDEEYEILEIDEDEPGETETNDQESNEDEQNDDLVIEDEISNENSYQAKVDSQIDDADNSPKYSFDAGVQTILTGSKELKVESKTEPESSETNVIIELPSSSTTPNINETNTGGKSTKLKPLDEGTVLNSRYEIIRKIGGGGMGAVYLASDRNLGGVLRAVKEMVQSYIEEAQQEKAISDFKRESMLLTSLEHSSIPTIYDYFYDEREARFYLVMKYISGGDLSARLKAAPEGRLDEKSVVEWGVQISDVLAYLHERQPPIVYRDLKPANIMIDGNSERVMLIDFGIARWINKEEKGVTAVGTMGYAPPELFSGNVEPRSDVYSLGSTMFHLLTGADPQSNPLLIFDFQKHPRPRQINPNLSDQIERILMRSVEYSAEKRFNSAAQMRDALIIHLEKLNNGQISFGIKQTPKPVGLEDQTVFCGFCGQKIVASDMFCAFCGAKQPLAQPGIHSKEYVHSKPTARLVISGTSELDSPTFVLEKTVNLVGRRDPLSNIFPEVDLSKYDPQTKISRKHAKISREGDMFLVEDLGSSNGTIIVSSPNNSVKLEPNKTQMLNDGDKIKIGDTTLEFIIQ